MSEDDDDLSTVPVFHTFKSGRTGSSNASLSSKNSGAAIVSDDEIGGAEVLAAILGDGTLSDVELFKKVRDLSQLDLELSSANLINCSRDKISRAIAVNTEIIVRIENHGIGSSNYLNCIDVLLILADLYSRFNDFRSAYLCKERALRIHQQLSILESSQHKSFIIDFLNGIALLARQAGDVNNAEAYYSESIQSARLYFGDFHPDVASGMVGLAQTYASRQQYTRSIDLLESAVEIYQSVQGINAKNTVNSKSMLAMALRMQAQQSIERSEYILKESIVAANQDDSSSVFFYNDTGTSVEDATNYQSIMDDNVTLAAGDATPTVSSIEYTGTGDAAAAASITALKDSTSASTISYQDDYDLGSSADVVITPDTPLPSFSHHQKELSAVKKQASTSMTNLTPFKNPYRNAIHIDSYHFFVQDSTKLVFAVPYLELPPAASAASAADDNKKGDLRHFLGRSNDVPYKAACSLAQEYQLPLFPSPLLHDGEYDHDKYREEFIVLSGYNVSLRIRRIVLEDEVKKVTDEIKRLKGLQEIIYEKKEFYIKRIKMLEMELVYIAHTNVYHLKIENPFHALLTLPQGWHFIAIYLQREYKRIQSSLHSLHDGATSVPHMKGRSKLGGDDLAPLQLDDIKSCWELLQELLLCHSLEIRAMTGPMKYPSQESVSESDGSKKQHKKHGSMIDAGGDVGSMVELHGVGGDQVSLLSNPTYAIIDPTIASVDDGVDGFGLDLDSLEPNQQNTLIHSMADHLDDASNVISVTTGVRRSDEREEEASVTFNPDTVTVTITGAEDLGSQSRASQGQSKSHSHRSSVLTLKPIVHGECFASWSNVCSVLEETPYVLNQSTNPSGNSASSPGLHQSLVFAVGSFITRIRANVRLSEQIPRSFISDILINLSEMTPFDQESNQLAALLTKISDIISQMLQNIMLPHLRLVPGWAQLLEALRKARLKSLGGKVMSADVGGSVEVDAYGIPRSIPNSDEVIDTDLLHGTMQRVKVDVATPEVKRRLDIAVDKRFTLRGELACLLQFMFMMNAPYCQRFMRGTLGRMKAARQFRDLAYESMLAAASTITLWYRALKGRQHYHEAKAAAVGNIKEQAAVVLQRFISTWVQWVIHWRYKRDKRARLTNFAICAFQGLIRGFIDRRRLKKKLSQNKEERIKEVKEWSAIGIQKLARGYIARKTVVKSLRIRRMLSKGVLNLAERFLKTGDMWGFLREVDDEFSRSQRELSENQQREDEMAATYITKVLARREDQFDGAWNQFSQSIGSWTSHNKTRGQNTASGFDENDVFTAEGDVKSGMINKNIPEYPTASLTSTAKSGLETALQGPLLRRAVTATVQQGVTQELDKLKKGESRSTKLIEDIRNVYGAPTSSAATTANKAMSKSKGKGIESNLQGKNSDIKLRAQIKANKRKAETAGGNKGQVQATSSDWLTGATSSNNSLGPSGSSTTGHIDMTHPIPGESLLIDIPMGVDDTIERLMKAAAIRCFVPEFFGKDRLPSDAYAMYLQMPPGLAKMRYEQETWKWCQGYINKLKLKGLKHIFDLLPLTRFRNYLQSVETPVVLINKCIDIYNDLKKTGEVHGRGASHGTAASTLDGILEGTVHLSHEISAIKTELSRKNEHGSPGNRRQEKEKGKKVEEASADVDPTFASRLLVSMVESGPWAHLSSPIDDLFLHAAYLVIPHVPYSRHASEPARKSSSTSTTSVFSSSSSSPSTELGHFAFKEHIQELQSMRSEMDQKESVKNRFRSALIFVTPYTLNLKSSGVFTILDLVKVNLPDLQMPAMLQAQVEALLSVAVSLAASGKTAPTIRDHLANSKEMFSVAMMYDPKFQRSPFDPFGRPSRLLPLSEAAKKSKLKNSKAGKAKNNAQRLDPIQQSAYPDGIWGHRDSAGDAKEGLTSTELSAEAVEVNLWKFHTNERHALHPNELIHSSHEAVDQYHLPQQQQQQQQQQRDLNSQSMIIPTTAPAPVGEGNAVLSRSVNYGLHSRPGTRATSVKDMQKKHSLYKRDFEAKIRSGFERPFACQYPGCRAEFSRLYTLKVHEKSHDLFLDYHAYKKQPQLFFDPDSESMRKEAEEVQVRKESLPPLVQQDLLMLQLQMARSREASREAIRGVSRGASSSSPSRPKSTANGQRSVTANSNLRFGSGILLEEESEENPFDEVYDMDYNPSMHLNELFEF